MSKKFCDHLYPVFFSDKGSDSKNEAPFAAVGRLGSGGSRGSGFNCEAKWDFCRDGSDCCNGGCQCEFASCVCVECSTC